MTALDPEFEIEIRAENKKMRVPVSAFGWFGQSSEKSGLMVYFLNRALDFFTSETNAGGFTVSLCAPHTAPISLEDMTLRDCYQSDSPNGHRLAVWTPTDKLAPSIEERICNDAPPQFKKRNTTDIALFDDITVAKVERHVTGLPNGQFSNCFQIARFGSCTENWPQDGSVAVDQNDAMIGPLVFINQDFGYVCRITDACHDTKYIDGFAEKTSKDEIRLLSNQFLKGSIDLDIEVEVLDDTTFTQTSAV